MKIAKWGNSLAVRLPQAVVEAMGLKEGDEVRLNPAGEKSFEIARAPDRVDLIERLRKYRGLMPDDFKFDRDEANSRE